MRQIGARPIVKRREAHRRRRPDRLRPCLQDEARRHRVEAQGLALSLGALARLAQNEEPGSASGETRSRRGLGPTVTSIDRHPPIGLYYYAASYHVAADLICDQGLRATHPEAPATFLCYHAIELYRKSFLRFHGVSAKRLQRGMTTSVCCQERRSVDLY
jgi:hypothetical protein